MKQFLAGFHKSKSSMRQHSERYGTGLMARKSYAGLMIALITTVTESSSKLIIQADTFLSQK